MSENDSTAPSADTNASEDQSLNIREPPRILIPVEVIKGESISESVVEFLAPAEIVLLGYHVLPEQTPTEQASMQFEDRAQEAIEDIASIFREAGREVETRVAFTHNRNQTVERVAAEMGATAVLLPNPAGRIEDVVVPLRGAIDVGRVTDLVATLLSGREATVKLWGISTATGQFDPEAAVEDARGQLIGRGLPAEQITTEVSEVETPIYEIVDRSGEFDLIVMGAGGSSLLTFLFGDPSERIAEGAVEPVLVVRNREPEEETESGQEEQEIESGQGE
ncbi:MAG: universal stress protein [Halolamina sp.]|uniref:universal stress protein n=1 Tax=Halolamina sp. TaxID=1940283 RepID=UPI002FC2AFBC